MLRRRAFLVSSAAGLAALAVPIGAAASNDWPVASPEAVGLDPGTLARISKDLDNGKLENIHGVVVVRHGQLAFEGYFSGQDERWGTPRGEVDFGPSHLHDVRSISKSVVALLYGLSLAEGVVPVLDQPVVDHFPYPDLGADPARREITIADVLSMQMGTAWDETIPYTDPRNSEIAMEMAPDRYRYVLEQPMVAPPGTQWTYNGGATALLGALIERGSNTDLAAYAESRLFGPLEIDDFEWVRGWDGVPAAASGLRLRPADLAKLAQLVLDGGRWAGETVVPADWIATLTQERIDLGDDYYYGYQWWFGRTPAGDPWMGGFGLGGQRLYLVPAKSLVVAILTGNYKMQGAGKQSTRLFEDYVLAALR